MGIRIVRLGSPRFADEGLRVGTVRRPPRGVRREDYATKDYFDVWLPLLAPQPATIKLVMGNDPESNWSRFVRTYRKEMAVPDTHRVIHLLAAFSANVNFSVGCYCEQATYCHRTILGELLVEAGALVVSDAD